MDIQPTDITTEYKGRTLIMVHADGPPCHGTPLTANPHVEGSRACPGCGISPDMQSIEFWPPEEVRR